MLPFLLMLTMLSGLASTSWGYTDSPSNLVELQVKAAFLYKLGNFVEWPEGAFADPDGSFTIGVMGADTFADVLTETVAGQTVKGRRVVVRKLRQEDTADDLHVLFIGQSLRNQLAGILPKVRRRALLIVTESDNALAFGSMINFVIVEGKVRFDIAPQTARQDGLIIGSRLLSVAHEVKMP
jgi:hypothetical protein